jgi:hypothetical protein
MRYRLGLSALLLSLPTTVLALDLYPSSQLRPQASNFQLQQSNVNLTGNNTKPALRGFNSNLGNSIQLQSPYQISASMQVINPMIGYPPPAGVPYVPSQNSAVYGPVNPLLYPNQYPQVMGSVSLSNQ